MGIALLSHASGWTFDGHHGDAAQEAQATVLGGLLFVALMGHWYLLYRPAYAVHDADFTLATAGVVLAAAVLWATIVWTRTWPAITRGMLALATSAVVMGSPTGCSSCSPPGSRRAVLPRRTDLWPIWVVLGPGLVCYAMYRVGREDAQQLRLTGFTAGCARHVWTKQWEEEADVWADHPVEFLSNKALLAHPMVLGMVFGQLCDGFA